jgi:hypothetical protein
MQPGPNPHASLHFIPVVVHGLFKAAVGPSLETRFFDDQDKLPVVTLNETFLATTSSTASAFTGIVVH